MEIYASLKEPLERIEPAVLGKVHEIIDELEIEEPPSSTCSAAAMRRLAVASAVLLCKAVRRRDSRERSFVEIIDP